MAVGKVPTTMPGAYSVFCNSCGMKQDWEVSEEEYEEDKTGLDKFVCKWCREGKTPYVEYWKG